jgi:hypothetical protein
MDHIGGSLILLTTTVRNGQQGMGAATALMGMGTSLMTYVIGGVILGDVKHPPLLLLFLTFDP